MIEKQQFQSKFWVVFQLNLPSPSLRMTFTTILSALALSSFTLVPFAQAQELRIGFAAPLSGNFEPLGMQLVKGAKVAAQKENVALIIADDQCSADGGKAAAEKFIHSNVQLAAGFLCSEALESALPLLAEKNIAILTSGVSQPTLTERRSSSAGQVFRLATDLEKEMQATGSFLASLWRSEPFAIIDDGTIEGRERAAQLLTFMKDQQLEPVFTDTYRPGLENQNALVARLRRAGATHVYVGGERDDIAAIGASSKAINYPLVIAGGSVLNAARGKQPLAEGTLMVAPLNPQDIPTAKAARDALRQSETLIEAYSLKGFAAVELAVNALRQAQEQKRSPVAILRNNAFETALGTIKFNQHGNRADNPNRLQSYNGQRFTAADR